MILIWRFGDHIKIAKLTYAIINPFILQAWVSLYTVLKTANLKSCQQRFLSKPPNVMFTNNSAYAVLSIRNYALSIVINLGNWEDSLQLHDWVRLNYYPNLEYTTALCF